ncbi:MAG: SLC45 family MFS transporter [Anaerolineae bacterium]|jgi:MFS family permease|nr:SLC45 family MFS transporter [Anaerolineae bacterium]PKO03888.1 MAG: MFS transporter [Chloroflexi bacterium HGW-Chloroflexi-5]
MKKFNYGKIFLLGFGFFGVSVIWTVYNAFVPLFLANKFDLSPALIGFFMTLDNIAALFIQPAVGSWSDKLRTKIGRRMPFILIGAPIGAAAFGLIPLAAILPLFVACTSTLLLSMAFWRTPVVALMPDITPSKYRSQANGIINLMGGLGTIIASLVGSTLYEININFPFWMGSALVLVAAALVFIFIKEPKQFEAPEKQPNMVQSFKEIITDKDKSGLRILLAIFFWFLAYSGIDAFLTLYATKSLGISEGDAGRMVGHMGIFFVLFAVVAGILGSKIGRKVTISIGIVLMAALILMIAILPAEFLVVELGIIPGLGMIRNVNLFLMGAGIAWSFININSLPMVVDLTTLERVGTFTGLYYLFSTFSAIVGPNLNGLIVTLSGNNYNTIMFFGPLFLMIALFLMLGVKRGEAVKGAGE